MPFVNAGLWACGPVGPCCVDGLGPMRGALLPNACVWTPSSPIQAQWLRLLSVADASLPTRFLTLRTARTPASQSKGSGLTHPTHPGVWWVRPGVGKGGYTLSHAHPRSRRVGGPTRPHVGDTRVRYSGWFKRTWFKPNEGHSGGCTLCPTHPGATHPGCCRFGTLGRSGPRWLYSMSYPPRVHPPGLLPLWVLSTCLDLRWVEP